MGPLPPAGSLLCLRRILTPRRPPANAPPPLRLRSQQRRPFHPTGYAAPPLPARARRRILFAAASGGAAAAAVIVPGALVAGGAAAAAGHGGGDGPDGDEVADGRADERRVLAPRGPSALARSARWLRRLWLLVDLYVWEPAATALRFLRLLALFAPLALASPAVWCGARDPRRGGERAGALWWYGALVRAMEKAGASFIKVWAP
jgi:aarF domain-containing kinase